MSVHGIRGVPDSFKDKKSAHRFFLFFLIWEKGPTDGNP
jgi:hypothetical protein